MIDPFAGSGDKLKKKLSVRQKSLTLVFWEREFADRITAGCRDKNAAPVMP